MTAKKDAENVVPAKPKVARARKEANTPSVSPEVQTVIDVANEVLDDPTVQVTVSKVTPKIPAAVRNALYTIGIIAGVAGTVAPIVAAALTGDAQVAIASIGAVALAFNSALAKFNLSKTAEDIAKEKTD